MTAILTSPGRIPGLSPSACPGLPSVAGQEAGDRRAHLQDAILANELRAKQAADQGDLTQAARFILAALDGERRMVSSGPQVLQVIKPRG